MELWPAPAAVAPAAAQGDEAADHEAGDGRARDQLLSVLVQLPAPVGQRGDPRAQHLHGRRELGLLEVDVGADLLGRSPGRAGARDTWLWRAGR